MIHMYSQITLNTYMVHLCRIGGLEKDRLCFHCDSFPSSVQSSCSKYMCMFEIKRIHVHVWAYDCQVVLLIGV